VLRESPQELMDSLLISRQAVDVMRCGARTILIAHEMTPDCTDGTNITSMPTPVA
jgi:hypothetical protein